MAHLCYNDLCTIKQALWAHAYHKEELSRIVTDEPTHGYILRDKEEAERLAKMFDDILNRVADLDLGKSVRITATWYK